MKKSTILLMLLLSVFFIPLPEIQSNSDDKQAFVIDYSKNEGYVAFIANEEPKEEDEVVVKCKCEGTKVIVHGDGHKTPCQCLNSGSGTCKCESPKEEKCNNPSCQCLSSGNKVCECDKTGKGCKNPSPKPPEPAPKPPEPAPAPKPPTPDDDEEPKPSPEPVKPKKVLMYFTASWCGPCQSFKATELPKIKKAGLTVSEIGDKSSTSLEIVDIDKHPDIWARLRNETGSIPCFIVLDSNKKETFKSVGYYQGQYKELIRAYNGAK